MVQQWTEPNVCLDENLATDQGLPTIQPWAIPRLVADVKAICNDGDGTVVKTDTLPGKLTAEAKAKFVSDSPLDQLMLIRIVRGPKAIQTSNPNAIQYRDRWTYTLGVDDEQPTAPTVAGLFNSQADVAIDLGTNSVAEPNPGQFWLWASTTTQDEWAPRALHPGETMNVWYQQYLWTPPPWSDNANKNTPVHNATAKYTRLQLWAFGQQGTVVVG